MKSRCAFGESAVRNDDCLFPKQSPSIWSKIHS